TSLEDHVDFHHAAAGNNIEPVEAVTREEDLKMKTSIKMLFAGAALSALTATGALPDEPPQIVYTTHPDSSNAFWLTVKQGMDDACALIQADCQMIFVSKPGDTQGQIANIEAAIAQKPDMIITSITDNKAYDAVVKEAIDAGIPVVASNVDDTEGSKGNARLAF